jgi:hypothetical protein
MAKQLFNDAAEVRKFLRAAGWTSPVTVKRVASPFGGSDRFLVSISGVPPEVSVISDSGSASAPTLWSSSDDGVTAARLEALDTLLANTNARAGGRQR